MLSFANHQPRPARKRPQTASGPILAIDLGKTSCNGDLDCDGEAECPPIS
jgi:hypothetical protein